MKLLGKNTMGRSTQISKWDKYVNTRILYTWSRRLKTSDMRPSNTSLIWANGSIFTVDKSESLLYPMADWWGSRNTRTE